VAAMMFVLTACSEERGYGTDHSLNGETHRIVYLLKNVCLPHVIDGTKTIDIFSREHMSVKMYTRNSYSDGYVAKSRNFEEYCLPDRKNGCVEMGREYCKFNMRNRYYPQLMLEISKTLNSYGQKWSPSGPAVYDFEYHHDTPTFCDAGRKFKVEILPGTVAYQGFRASPDGSAQLSVSNGDKVCNSLFPSEKSLSKSSIGTIN
jgi:hypothetical protein